MTVLEAPAPPVTATPSTAVSVLFGTTGDLQLTFTITDESIGIRGEGLLTPGQKVRTELTDFSRMILDTVVDTATLEQTDGSPVFELSKAKSA